MDALIAEHTAETHTNLQDACQTLTGEAIVSFKKQTEIWLPEDRDQGCGIIGKFTQGSKADGKRLTRRLVTDQGELDYLLRATCQSGCLVGMSGANSDGY